MKLRILQVTHRYPPHHGGVEYHVQLLSKWLASKGHEVTVLTSSHPGTPNSYYEEGVRVIRLKVLASPFRNPITPGIIIKFRELREEYDLVHAHVPYAFPSLVSVLMAPGSKTIVTLHGRPFYDGLGRILIKVYEPFIFRVIRKASKIIVLTKFDLEFLKSKGVEEEKLVMIPNFINLKEIENVRRELRGTERDGPVKLIFVGALTERKGVLQLMNDLNRLGGVMLKVVGDGPLRSRVIKEAGKNVEYVGSLEKKEDVLRLIAESDALILPSKSEGMPTVILEAMALGRPVILSDIPSHREAFGDIAIYFRPGDLNSLKSSLEKLRYFSDLIIKRAINLVKEKYDIDAVGPKILALYCKVAGRSGENCE